MTARVNGPTWVDTPSGRIGAAITAVREHTVDARDIDGNHYVGVPYIAPDPENNIDVDAILEAHKQRQQVPGQGGPDRPNNEPADDGE